MTNTGDTAASPIDAAKPPFIASTWGNIYYDFFTASKDAMFVDLLRNFRYVIDDPIGNSGKPDKLTINASSANTYFTGTWSPNILNVPYNVSGHVGILETESAPAGKHYFSLDAGSGDLPTSIPAGKALIIYFEAHLSKTFVWEHGLEGQYATTPPYDTQGGDAYDGWTTTDWLGSGATAGSSPHFNYDATGFGAITVPIPIPAAPPGIIDGYKFDDLDSDGVKDAGEPGLEGWSISIGGLEPQGLKLYASTLTDSTGYYSFPRLTRNSTWYLAENATRTVPVQSAWSQTYPYSIVSVPPVATSIETTDFPPAIEIPGESDFAEWGYQVSLTDAEPHQHNINFGNYMPGSGCISGTKYNSCDGVVEGWTINLYAGDDDPEVDDPIATTTTNSTGGYKFCGLTTPGDYIVCEEVDEDYWIALTDTCIEVTLGATDVTEIDFTNKPKPCISGAKINGDTLQGIEGWAINLKVPSGALIATTTTNSSGGYEFCGLEPGEYTVCEEVEEGWTAVGDTCIDVEVDYCADSTGNDFTNTPPPPPPPGEVGGTIYPANKGVMLIPIVILAVALLSGTMLVFRRKRIPN